MGLDSFSLPSRDSNYRDNTFKPYLRQRENKSVVSVFSGDEGDDVVGEILRQGLAFRSLGSKIFRQCQFCACWPSRDNVVVPSYRSFITRWVTLSLKEECDPTFYIIFNLFGETPIDGSTTPSVD